MSSTNSTDNPDLREIVVCAESARMVHAAVSALIDLYRIEPLCFYADSSPLSDRDKAAEKIREFARAFVYGFVREDKERLLLEMLFTDGSTHTDIMVPVDALEGLFEGLNVLAPKHGDIAQLRFTALAFWDEELDE